MLFAWLQESLLNSYNFEILKLSFITDLSKKKILELFLYDQCTKDRYSLTNCDRHIRNQKVKVPLAQKVENF